MKSVEDWDEWGDYSRPIEWYKRMYHSQKDEIEYLQEELDIWKRKYNLLMHQHDMFVYETKKRGNAVYNFLPIFRGKDLGTDVIDMMIEIGKPVKAVELAMTMPYSEHEILGALSDGVYQGLVMKDNGAWVVTDEARDLWECE